MQDKTLKVWDVRNWRCLQSISDKEMYCPDDVITGLTMNPEHSHVVTGNLRLKAWPLEQALAQGALGHTTPVSQVICNSVFNDAVSADRSGSVCVWSAQNGRLRFRCDPRLIFNILRLPLTGRLPYDPLSRICSSVVRAYPHVVYRFDHAHGAHAVTCIAFDTTQRRLLTGADNGEVKAWNFSSGMCLTDMVSSARKDVTGAALLVSCCSFRTC